MINKFIFIIVILLLLISIIIILILISKYMNKPKSVNYLNYNSTYATKTGYLNPSDLGYSEMRLQQK